MTETQRKGLSQILTTIDIQLKQFYLFEWFRFFLRYDQRPTLRKVQIPVLAPINLRIREAFSAHHGGVVSNLWGAERKETAFPLCTAAEPLTQI